MYKEGMQIDQVDTTFQELSKVAFRGRNLSSLNPFGLIKSYMHGQFPAEDINRALCKTFGETTSMFNHPYMSSIGARIGFPVVDLDNTKSTGRCLVTSYNGVGDLSNSSYRLLRSKGPNNGILVKDA
jgi:hypothetical protein